MSRDVSVSPQPVLLGFLMSGPHHGYELHREFSRELGQVWRIGRSQLYAQLKQMEESGMVSVETEFQPSRPLRKVYHLTPSGREHFLEWLNEPIPHLRHIRLEFLARLFFYRRLSLPGLEELVARQKEILASRAASLRRSAAETDDDFRRLVLEFRRGQMEAAVCWLDRCLETT